MLPAGLSNPVRMTMKGAKLMIDRSKMPRLGFGMMRLPQKDGVIDIGHVCRMVDAYMKAGLNYFDSAYVYHGGHSEEAMKAAIVDRYPRESFMPASKLPAWEMTTREDRDRIFNEQLARAGVDYFDFYLLHSVEEGHIGTYERLDCFNWAMQKKAEGLPLWIEPLLIKSTPRIVGDTADDFGFHARTLNFKVFIKSV